ncbi:polyphosphate kinase [Paracrocinitomix mangrovi]|uniref:PPK2 family polyphosphate kinase n=1 Tax=Paracrocinitomix mangrovi TaxID=2862509 RepID=UPI001C8D483F|nr:PPK2 family polyphosphate kinase [Paracrocinitomix mangrovi]UKN00126.1 polyphosphate kinase [Paracrocinitomix mangrovi]
MAKLLTASTQGPEDWDKEAIKAENRVLIARIAELQRILYAQSEKSLLVILQGVDASGKDGTVRRIFSGVNPLGCRVYSFKKPTEEEMAHDFLWRVHKVVPAKGMIHIFNRSHYEDILVPTVLETHSKDQIEKRYDQINEFEKLLESNGTKILKFYLHISKEEQLERLTERIENPQKHWKHNDGDWNSRKMWDDYMNVYETIFKRCNNVLWDVIPADRNWVKINFIAKRIIEAMEQMDLKWPELESDKFNQNK